MKELADLASQIIGNTNVSKMTDNPVGKSAGIGAGVGAALGAKNGEILKNAAVGAGVGALIGWALNEFSESDNASESQPKALDQTSEPG